MTQALLGTSEINQICFVVKDIEKAAGAFAGLLGIEKPNWFLTGTQEISQIVYNGVPTPARNKLIFINTSSVQIELIEPDQEPSTMRDFLNQQEGIHHVAVNTDDMKKQLALLGENGYGVIQTGEFTASKGRYAYVNTVPACKTMVELLERDEPQPIPPVKPRTADDPQPLLGTDTLTQIAVVVKDLDAAAEAYCALLGVEKPTVLKEGDSKITQVVYRGEPTEAKAHFLFIKTPMIEIELIEPGDSPSTWKEHLETKGEGIHHISFHVKNMDEKIAILEEKGYPVIQKGNFFNGTGRYAYMDTTSDYHVIIELLEKFEA
ncbi:VOC family protein [Brevibacillus centrosporus]|uniref:VOC family protein n=1 Tax=Brevibacillus centrosporus TaxID=54910 RepID=UPI002E23B490|nr:VOC family protein [Brevibacillus centrosporus]